MAPSRKSTGKPKKESPIKAQRSLTKGPLRSETKTTTGIFQRAHFWLTKTGETVLKFLKPMRDEASFTVPAERDIIRQPQKLMAGFRITDFLPLRSRENPNRPMMNSPGGRHSWICLISIHDNISDCTLDWCKRWVGNITQLFTRYGTNKEFYDYTTKFAMDPNYVPPEQDDTYLGDLLMTEDVFKVMMKSHTQVSLKEMMRDDDFALDYFGEHGITAARVFFNEHYGEDEGNLTVEPSDPRLFIPDFQDI